MKEIDEDGAVTIWIYKAWYFGFLPVMFGYYEDDFVAVKPRFGIPMWVMELWESLWMAFGYTLESMGYEDIDFKQPVYWPGRLDGKPLGDEDRKKLEEDF